MNKILVCSCLLALALVGRADAQGCPNNLVSNGDFSSGLVFGSMGSGGQVDDWSPLTATAQVIPTGCAAGGALQMWGNLVVGESVEQALTGPGIQAGKTYRISLSYHHLLAGPDPADEVAVRVAASSSNPVLYPPTTTYDVIGVTPMTSSATCVTHTFLWTAPNNASFLTLNPENDSSVDHGSYVSWAVVDDVCIQEVELDHFSGYQVKTASSSVKFDKFGPLVLADQFGSMKYDVLKPRELHAPADKNAEGVFDDDTHLEEYQIKPRGAVAVTSPVQIINQCNDLLVEVRKPRTLLVPTAKTPPPGMAVPPPPDPQLSGVDHFLCYQARAAKVDGGGNSLPRFPRGIQVEVVDQFQTRRYDLRKITKLCNPVAKTEDVMDPVTYLSGALQGQPKPIQQSTVRNPADHLICYQAALSKSTIPQSGCGCDTILDPGCKGVKIVPPQAAHMPVLGLNVANQFGAEVLDTSKHREICIPSQKLLVP